MVSWGEPRDKGSVGPVMKHPKNKERKERAMMTYKQGCAQFVTQTVTVAHILCWTCI
jgi:hypothetical protein